MRSQYRWGAVFSELPFGGRRIRLRRPRLRGRLGGEAQLQSLEQFRAADPAPAKALDQILLGVSPHGYQKSLDPAPAGIAARGASKSAARRHLVARMTDKLKGFLPRPLDEVEPLVLMPDGLRITQSPPPANSTLRGTRPRYIPWVSQASADG